MDIVEVFEPLWSFFVKFCNVQMTLGGYTFSVGALFVWCVLASILICFVKGLAK